jgi:hypothetical protein
MKIPRFAPVVHVSSDDLAVAQAKLVLDCGAGGFFLIDHSRGHEALLRTYAAVRAALPDAWIGLNFLDLDPMEAITALPEDAQALWVDDGGIDEWTQEQPRAAAVLKAIRDARPHALLYGGVAFKYQDAVKSPAAVAALAAPYMDVVTTSGSGTGKAPSPDKIIAMKAAIGDKALAVASGISAENVHLFRDHVDCFMVASSIAAEFDTFNPVKVVSMAAAIHAK